MGEHSDLRFHHLHPSIPVLPRIDTVASFDSLLRLLPGAGVLSTAHPGMRITIAFTDSTRHSPDHLMVGWLLHRLHSRGVDDSNVTLLCATGLHRPMTYQERVAKLGRDLVERLTIIDHDAVGSDRLVHVGEVDGIPVVVNRACVECDLLLATGVVEPHQYTGYSGGAKTIVIGCGGEEVIAGTHSVSMIDREGVTIGSIAANPFQAFLRRAGELIGIDAIVNVVLDGAGGILDGAAGNPIRVHDDLIARARATREVTVDRPMNMAVIGVPQGKGANIYQASRAATYAALAERSPLIDGAPIILLADVPEGVGSGLGEKRFGELLAGEESLDVLLNRFRHDGFPAGGQRAYIVARVLRDHPIIIVGRGDPDAIRSCRMIPAARLKEGVDIGVKLIRDAGASDTIEVMVLSNGMVIASMAGC